jgi:two-component system, NarL family, sensor histidine kinase UhpB
MQELASAVFDHAPLGIAVADAGGRYVAANPAFLGMLGYSGAELLGRSIHDVTHPQDKEEYRRVFEDIVAGVRNHIEFEKRHLRKDGRELRVRSTVARIPGDDGMPRFVLAMVEDITVRREADERAWLQERLHALTRRLVDAEEFERHRIAGELHDRVGQHLSALSINLDIAQGLSRPEDLELRMRLADSVGLLEATLQSIENVMAELRPPLIDEYGLSAALGLYARNFAQRAGVSVAVDDRDELGAKLPRETAIVLFRIVQEALANVAKHAAARRVKILLERHDHGLALEISDDGSGFDPRERLAQTERWGVTTMQERAGAIRGALSVTSAPAAGTTVRVCFPAPA